MGRLGAHVSVAGGLASAFARAAELSCEALQIFVKSASRWQARPLEAAEIAAFRRAHCAQPLPVVAHASYLINLCAADPAILRKSRAALADELSRCDALGIAALVVHPGAHVGQGEQVGRRLVAQSLDAVLAGLPQLRCRLLLENTAGQGSVIGARFEALAEIIAGLDAPAQVGVCVDSCHAIAAGYPLDAPDGYEQLLAAIEASVGLTRVGCWHVNDSAFARGARKDRHVNIGQGHIRGDFFAALLSDANFAQMPMILETPLGEDGLGHARDLAALRAISRGSAG